MYAVETLGKSCKPEDHASLVLVAAGAAGASPDVRCAAMKKLARFSPTPEWRDAAVTEYWVAALGRPDVRDAISTMLRDREAMCAVDSSVIRGDGPHKLSPSEVGLWVLLEFPVPALKAAVEQLPSDAVGDRDRVLHEYDAVSKQHDSQWVTYVDRLTASGTPSAFEGLVEFVGAGMPWPSNLLPVPPDEKSKALSHVGAALEWLRLLVSQAPGDDRWSMVCVQDLKQAVRGGRLGELLLADFDKFDADARRTVMYVFVETARPGSRARLEEIAAHDPDERVRDTAAVALKVIDVGGTSAVEGHGSGSGKALQAPP